MTAHHNADLHRLTYLSAAQKEITGADLDAILETARANNGRHDVTGLLIYHDMQFCQTLEGPWAEVEPLYNHIKKDPRHTGCIVLERRPVAERFFNGWSMAYKNVSELGATQKRNFLDLTGVRGQYASPGAKDDARTRVLIDSFVSSFRDLDLN